jgi:anti-sigma factor RsiW
MTGKDCEMIREWLPEMNAGTLSAEDTEMVHVHLEGCPECRKELELIGFLREAMAKAEGAADVPPGLEARIKARIREDLAVEQSGAEGGRMRREVGFIPILGRISRAPPWALSAAAVVILALGTGVIWNQKTSESGLDPVVVATQDPLPESWLWDDGLVAGAPVFDGLSDAELEVLVKEFGG